MTTKTDGALYIYSGECNKGRVGDLADTADIDEFRAAIDHARRIEGEGE